MHPSWPRNLRDQCAQAKVPFLFKQWGEWRPMEAHEVPVAGMTAQLVSDGSRPTTESGAYHQARQLLSMIADPEYGWQHPIIHVGKQEAGRLLDGVLHDGFPAACPAPAKQEQPVLI